MCGSPNPPAAEVFVLSPCHTRVGSGFVSAVVGLVAAMIVTDAVSAEDTAGLRTYTGRRKIQLWPIEQQQPKTEEVGRPITLGNWTYQASRTAVPRDGVPWELIVTPTGPGAETWKKGEARALLPGLTAEFRGAEMPTKIADALPVIQLPDTLWKNWMAPDLQDVVGIHFHAMVTDDQARILYTLHKVPPDNPDGTSGMPESGAAPVGTRIEATLLAPVTYCLDQTIIVREDPHDRQRVRSRGEHELSHAEISQQVLVAVLRGPQDWDPIRCMGRRSQVSYYWKREQIGRAWQGYRDGSGKVLTLRTSIVLVPPTRWSMLIPIPPERVTHKHLERFNESIVHVGESFATTDRLAQERFHAEHGAYE